MSRYTTTIQTICKAECYQNGYDISNMYYEDIISTARPYVFSFDYPFFDINRKVVLETKILKHYYFDEIAHETYERFKLRLNDRLNLIMPRYNELYRQLETLGDIYSKTITSDQKTVEQVGEDIDGTKKDNTSTDAKSKTSTNSSTDTSHTGDIQNSGNSQTITDTAVTSNNKTVTTLNKNDTTWDISQNIPENNDYQSLSYVSSAVKHDTTGTETTTATNDSSVDTNSTVDETDSSIQTLNTKDNTINKNTVDNMQNSTTLYNSVDNTHRDLDRDITVTSNDVIGYDDKLSIYVQYANKINDIDKMIIDDLSCLFMQIF